MTETAASPSQAAADHPVFTHQEILRVFSGVALAMLMAAKDQTIVCLL